LTCCHTFSIKESPFRIQAAILNPGFLFVLKPGAPHPVTNASMQHGRAFVFSAYARKSKPPALRVVDDSAPGRFIV